MGEEDNGDYLNVLDKLSINLQDIKEDTEKGLTRLEEQVSTLESSDLLSLHDYNEKIEIFLRQLQHNPLTPWQEVRKFARITKKDLALLEKDPYRSRVSKILEERQRVNEMGISSLMSNCSEVIQHCKQEFVGENSFKAMSLVIQTSKVAADILFKHQELEKDAKNRHGSGAGTTIVIKNSEYHTTQSSQEGTDIVEVKEAAEAKNEETEAAQKVKEIIDKYDIDSALEDMLEN